MKRFLNASCAVLLCACFATPTPEPTSTPRIPFIIMAEDNPFAPKPEGRGRQRAGAVLTSISLVEQTDLAPVRVALNISGSLPSVCNELRVEVAVPDDEYQIFVEVYSLVNRTVDCENVFQQFEASVLLGAYSAGRYTVWVNQERVGDFVAD